MKFYTRAEAHRLLDKWLDENIVGNFVAFHKPQGKEVGIVIEQTIKRKEMNGNQRAALTTILEVFDFARITDIARNEDGEPDRLRGTREFS